MNAARRLVVVVAVWTVVGVACSVPLDEGPTVIAGEELPESLQSTTTTTIEPSDVVETITVTYFLINRPQAEPPILQAVERSVPEGTLASYLERAFNLDFRLPAEQERLVNPLENWTLISAGRNEDNEERATIDIAPLDPDNPPPDDVKKDTAAQLVYFLAAFGIRELRLLIDGDDQVLPTENANTEPGDLLTTDLYPLYAPDRTLPTTTTTQPTTTTSRPSTTTSPPSTTEAPADGG